MPDDWHLVKIAGNCSNYRPISLLSASYKLFALVLLNRLREATVDEQIWPTQFGFMVHVSQMRCSWQEDSLIKHMPSKTANMRHSQVGGVQRHQHHQKGNHGKPLNCNEKQAVGHKQKGKIPKTL